MILVGAAIGLFVVYTNPTYQAAKQLVLNKAEYDAALDNANQLHATRDALLAKRKQFSPEDMDRLMRMLPDNVDNIRLIIDINGIARRHNLSLTNVSLGDLGDKNKSGATAVGTGQGAVGSVTVGFSVSATYDDLVSFLQDLEHSLRIVDIQKVSFSAGNGDLQTFSLQVKTYWLH